MTAAMTLVPTPRKKEALPVLLRHTDDSVSKLNRKFGDLIFAEGVLAISKLGDDARPAIPALVKWLSQLKKDGIRLAVYPAGALLIIDPNNRQSQLFLTNSLQQLIDVLDDHPLFAADVLARLGPKARSAAPHLQPYLKHQDPEVRKAISEAMKKITAKEDRK